MSALPPPPGRALIEVDGVSKWFGSVVALSDVSLTIGDGITALLGPNGTGKSTLFRLLCGLTTPSRGSIRVFGGDPRADLGLLRRIGLVPQQEGVFEPLDAFGFVRLAAVLHRLDDPDAAAVEALGVVALDPDDRRPLTQYSKGMRQRVKIAQAIVHRPELLFLDEPLTGLDPRQRVHIIDVIRRIGAAGTGVVVSSHVLDEVERFGSRVLVIVQGRLAAEGDFRAIRDLMDDRPRRFRIVADDARPVATGLLDAGVAVGVRLADATTVEVDTDDVVGFRHAVARVAAERGIRLTALEPLDDDLESVFRYLVGR